jgi:hypothetical protein
MTHVPVEQSMAAGTKPADPAGSGRIAAEPRVSVGGAGAGGGVVVVGSAGPVGTVVGVVFGVVVFGGVLANAGRTPAPNPTNRTASASTALDHRRPAEQFWPRLRIDPHPHDGVYLARAGPLGSPSVCRVDGRRASPRIAELS